MGFIAALLSKTGEDVSGRLLQMLEVASPNRGHGYGVGTPEGAYFSFSQPETLSFDSEVMLGHKLVKIMPNDPPQPVSQHGYTMMFEGRLWGRSITSDFSVAADVVGVDPSRGIHRLIEEENGSYVVIAVDKGRIICGRDPVGVVPLYIGETETLAGAASNRKTLWTMGIEPEPLPPGCMAEITKGGVRLRKVRGLRQPSVRTVTMEEALETLDRLLHEAVEARSRGVLSASLGFSGGIDSSLLAHYLDLYGVEVDLVCVGLEGSAEFEAAEEAADDLGLPIRLESFTTMEMEQDLEAVLRSVEEPDPMKISIALPLRRAAQRASEHGSQIFYSGSGSDEIFGGYLKYVREYAESGGAVIDTMFKDVEAAYKINFERDFKVCADMGVEMRLPFSDWSLIDFGLGLPINLKFSVNEGSSRKLLLRELGRRIGLRDTVAFRRKRAIQYSTGVSRALRRLARRRGMTSSQYLTERFNLIRKEYREKGPTNE